MLCNVCSLDLSLWTVACYYSSPLFTDRISLEYWHRLGFPSTPISFVAEFMEVSKGVCSSRLSPCPGYACPESGFSFLLVGEWVRWNRSLGCRNRGCMQRMVPLTFWFTAMFEAGGQPTSWFFFFFKENKIYVESGYCALTLLCLLAAILPLAFPNPINSR